ncbi:MAG: DUF1850 domain-containing protein [Bacillota bacterium]
MTARFCLRAGPGFLLALAILLGGAWLAGCQHVLVVREADTHRRLLVGFLAPGEKFAMRFIHSVDRLPVYDEFRFLDGTLVLTGTRCLSFGAGLGYTGEGVLTGENGWDVIAGMHRRVGALPLRVGTVADHTIIYRGREVHLNRYFRGQTLVHLEVKRLLPGVLPGILKGDVLYAGARSR